MLQKQLLHEPHQNPESTDAHGDDFPSFGRASTARSTDFQRGGIHTDNFVSAVTMFNILSGMMRLSAILTTDKHEAVIRYGQFRH